MKTIKILLLLCVLSTSLFGQVIHKPKGCFAGTNGTNKFVLAHEHVRGVLLTERWADIELSPGVYDFTSLNAKINTVKVAGLNYAIAISCGAFGSPDWLIDSLDVSYHHFQYQDKDLRLPLWWDTMCKVKLTDLITQLGNQYASDSMLSHVYVSQMTVNGIEGHLNGVNMSAFEADGYTDAKWVAAAKATTYTFANAFPNKPIVFEVHEINRDTIVPATIINDLRNDPSLCNRVGLAMWWISGKTSYQSSLLDFIYHFEGDKYAQVIGRSDQVERFNDGVYASVFTQAKYLNIRYLEPWPYEFQFQTNDSLIQDFNRWADTRFAGSDTCTVVSSARDIEISNKVGIYPNPTSGVLTLNVDQPYQNIEINLSNLNGVCLLTTRNQTKLDLRRFPQGIYFISVTIDKQTTNQKIVKLN